MRTAGPRGQHARMDLARSAQRDTADGPDGPPPVRVREVIPVNLFEDADGRLVVVDGRVRPPPHPDTGPLLRIGRTRLALHHLAPSTLDRLAARGSVVVDGPDALNVLLALADFYGGGRDAGSGAD